MNFAFHSKPSAFGLAFAASMITCLALVINASFKLVQINGFIFTANSVICPLFAGLYLLTLKRCSLEQQKQLLHLSLVALYLYSIGIYLLVNLPAVEHMHKNIAYQIVFEEIPRKFFSSTLAFLLSFYLPHFYCSYKLKSPDSIFATPLVRALGGGLLFFTFNFALLFIDPMVPQFFVLYFHSLLVALGLLASIALAYIPKFFGYISFPLIKNNNPFILKLQNFFLCLRGKCGVENSPIYYALVSFSIVILLISLAFEYRVVSLFDHWVVVASGILAPLLLLTASLIYELFGYKASFRLLSILIVSELSFDFSLMAIAALPSPNFLNLDPFFWAVMPRRIPGTTFTLMITLLCNIFLLGKLKKTIYGKSTALRLALAGIGTNSVLCLVNYAILFAGVYSYELAFNLALISWTYKFALIIICLPLVVLMNNILREKLQGGKFKFI